MRCRDRDEHTWTADELRRIRAAAEASITPGLEDLAAAQGMRRPDPSPTRSPRPTRKRGRR